MPSWLGSSSPAWSIHPRPCVSIALPIAWVWPILLWSAIGNREIHNNVQQMTFSSASPLLRQLPAQWLAGFIVTLLVSIGAIIRLTVDGDTAGLLALLSGAFFIPSLALASGVWSGTSKLFEILYMLIWYLGPLNKLVATGLHWIAWKWTSRILHPIFHRVNRLCIYRSHEANPNIGWVICIESGIRFAVISQVCNKYDYPNMIFGRYCNASAKCADCISSLPARSAIVLASFKIR